MDINSISSGVILFGLLFCAVLVVSMIWVYLVCQLGIFNDRLMNSLYVSDYSTMI